MDNQALAGLTMVILQSGTKWVAWGTVSTLIAEIDQRANLCRYYEGPWTEDDGDTRSYLNTDAGRYAAILQEAGFVDLKTGQVKEPTPTGSARDDARVQEVLKSIKGLMGCVSDFRVRLDQGPRSAPAAPNGAPHSSQ